MRGLATLLCLTIAVLLLIGESSQETNVEHVEGVDPTTKLTLEGQTTKYALDQATICAMTRSRRCGVKDAIARGLFETGLTPLFPKYSNCRDTDDHYAMDYTHKRPRENYHGGIDIPAPFGVPMLAASAGMVVAIYPADNSPRGIEIVLRHSPKDTGLPYWIYTQYAHFDEMPKQAVGQHVSVGEVLGPTGNSGLHPRKGGQHTNRRPAMHFAAFYTANEQFVEYSSHYRTRIIPVDFQWMDPLALYREKVPLDSHSMKALPEGKKRVPISIIFEDGEIFSLNKKFIWPYKCKRRSHDS